MVHPPGSFKSPGPPEGRQARLQAGPRAGLTHFSMRCTNPSSRLTSPLTPSTKDTLPTTQCTKNAMHQENMITCPEDT